MRACFLRNVFKGTPIIELSSRAREYGNTSNGSSYRPPCPLVFLEPHLFPNHHHREQGLVYDVCWILDSLLLTLPNCTTVLAFPTQKRILRKSTYVKELNSIRSDALAKKIFLSCSSTSFLIYPYPYTYFNKSSCLFNPLSLSSSYGATQAEMVVCTRSIRTRSPGGESDVVVVVVIISGEEPLVASTNTSRSSSQRRFVS